MNWISDRAEIADFGDQGHAQHAGGEGREGKACGVHRLQKFCASDERVDISGDTSGNTWKYRKWQKSAIWWIFGVMAARSGLDVLRQLNSLENLG